MILDTGKVISCVHEPENVCVHVLCVFPYGCILRAYCMYCVCACTILCIIIMTTSLFFYSFRVLLLGPLSLSPHLGRTPSRPILYTLLPPCRSNAHPAWSVDIISFFADGGKVPAAVL